MIRQFERNRLAYYWVSSTVEFWDKQWKAQLSRSKYHAAERGELRWIEEAVIHYLPKHGCVLDAGCGLGEHVMALKFRGYDVEGVEWSQRTVESIKSLFHDLPIRNGDVTHLEVPDGYYSGYISLGVMEHSQEGPEPFLSEAYRVLRKGGVALISVPYFHYIRKLKARVGFYHTRNHEMDFYQYAFTEEEFSNILQLAGFNIIDKMGYDVIKGIVDETPFVHYIFRWPGIGWRLKKFLHNWKWGSRNLGHMILFVCRK